MKYSPSTQRKLNSIAKCLKAITAVSLCLHQKKNSPRKKHIALKYHRFRRFVIDNIVEILPIDTKEKIADIFTKPLDKALFLYLRKKAIRLVKYSKKCSPRGNVILILYKHVLTCKVTYLACNLV